MLRRSVGVDEPDVRRYRIDVVLQGVGPGHTAELQNHWIRGARRDGEPQIVSARGLGRNHEYRGPAKLGQRESPARVAFGKCVVGDVHTAQNFSWSQHILMITSNEILCCDSSFGSIRSPQA